MNEIEQIFSDFLEECEEILNRIDECTEKILVETYQLLEICARRSCVEIATIDCNYRVRLCRMMDLFLNHIVDEIPVFEQNLVNIFTPAIQGYRSWINVELMKDKCLTGYMMARAIGAKSHMFFMQEKIGGGVSIC